MNHDEHNHSTLKEALQRLPQYAPPPSVWGELEQELDKADRELPLRQAIGQLPAYSPPAEVWESIANSLEEEPSRKTRRIQPWIWTAAAASIALLIGAFLFWPDSHPSLQIKYTYEQRAENTGLYQNDWDEDEDIFHTVSQQFSQDPVARQHPEFGNIIAEWEELGDARTEITEMIELYGKDARLIRRLVDVEQERSRIIKKMAAEM